MIRIFTLSFLILFWVLGAQAETQQWIVDEIDKEVRALLVNGLWQDYDIQTIDFLSIEKLPSDTLSSEEGYVNLLKIGVKFRLIRNQNKSRMTDSEGNVIFQLDPHVYDNRESCEKGRHFYLHCGVEPGYVFKGVIEFYASRISNGGDWKILCNKCDRRKLYPLDGYLVLEGKQKEGYVLFPKDTNR